MDTKERSAPPVAGSVVVLGCGRLGAYVARTVHAVGGTVRVVDCAAEACGHLPAPLAGAALVGDALLPEVLQAAGIDRADSCLAATGDDVRNAALAMICRRLFGTRLALARIRDLPHAVSYRQAGIAVLCPAAVVAERVARRVRALAG